MKPSIVRKIMITLFCITIVVLFVLIYFVPSVSDTFTPTMLAEYDKVLITDDIEGYIIREEAVYFAPRAGIVENLIAEGEKVRRREKIITITGYTVEDNEEMAAVRSKIDRFSGGNNIFANDLAKLDEVIKKTRTQLNSAKKRGNADEQRELEDKIARLEAKRLLIAGPDEHMTSSGAVDGEQTQQTGQTEPETQEEPVEQKKPVAVAVITNRKNAEQPLDVTGYVSYYVDGFETEFTPENMYILNKQKVLEQDYTPVNTYQIALKQGDPAYKIVKSSTWYVVSWIDPEDVTKYTKGNIIRMEFAGREISGKIDDIVDVDQDIVVILKFETYFPEVAQQRKIDARVITLDSDGLRIGNRSLTTEDGVIGVYVKNLDGKFEFRPVKIIRTDGEFAIVYSEYFEEQIEEQVVVDGVQTTEITVRKVTTIKPYDEILKNGGEGKQ